MDRPPTRVGDPFTYIYHRRPWLWLFRVVDFLGYCVHRPKLGVPDLSPVRSILVIKLDQIGDLVLTQPLLAALRQAAPTARIELVVGKERRQVVKGFNVDRVSELPVRLRSHRPPDLNPRDLILGLRELRTTRPEVTILAKEDPFTVLFGWLIGSPTRIGYREGGLGFLLTHAVPIASPIHQSQVLARLAGAAGETSVPPSYPISPEEEQSARLLLETLDVPRHLPLILLHPGAGDPEKQWPWECFVETLIHVSRMQRVACLVALPREWTSKVLCLDLKEGSWCKQLPQMSLGTFAGLLARADLFLGNDSAPAHLAAAVGTPALAVFLSPADPVRWGPFGTDSLTIGAGDVPPMPEQVADLVLQRLRALSAHRMKMSIGSDACDIEP